MEIRETRRYDSSPRKDAVGIVTTVKVFYLLRAPSKHFYPTALAIQLNSPVKVFPKQSKRERITSINTYTDEPL